MAKEEFLREEGTIEGAIQRVAPSEGKQASNGLGHDIASLVESVKRYPWTTLESLRGDPAVLKRIDDAEKVLKDLKHILAR